MLVWKVFVEIPAPTNIKQYDDSRRGGGGGQRSRGPDDERHLRPCCMDKNKEHNNYSIGGSCAAVHTSKATSERIPTSFTVRQQYQYLNCTSLWPAAEMFSTHSTSTAETTCSVSEEASNAVVADSSSAIDDDGTIDNNYYQQHEGTLLVMMGNSNKSNSYSSSNSNSNNEDFSHESKSNCCNCDWEYIRSEIR